MTKTKTIRVIWCEFCSTTHPKDWHARVKRGDQRPMYLPDVRYESAGPEGQDRESYTDDQDRESYTVEGS